MPYEAIPTDMNNIRADLLIKNGMFYGMTGDSDKNGAIANVAVKDGKIAAIASPGALDAFEYAKVFDASGMVVAPGFVDIHIHDEDFADEDTVQHCMIKQGVTSALAGNCGLGPLFAASAKAREHPWINLAYLIGNCVLREAVGRTDNYTAATEGEISRMKTLLREGMKQGAKGLSLGLEYAPGASYEELSALFGVVSEFEGRIVAAHIRYDDERSPQSIEEVIRLAEESGVRVQVSHLGSMTMGRTRLCADIIALAALRGVDVSFDCYPYDAFCTYAGSAVYDRFAERYSKGAECLEAVSGKFKNQRLTSETLAEMRAQEPNALIVAYVMDKDEIEECIARPDCVVASDALSMGGGAHPRVAGTFPRALGILRKKGYSWSDALAKVTVMPAMRAMLDAGRLYELANADITVFDPDGFTDRSTFQEPFLPSAGLKLVVINGRIAFEDGKIASEKNGKFVRA
ncbi:N-acyl-D-glutamate deacylase [Synergistales bacterium]|nr:N-acyl-D-glutamate deacylase [Synergistales bacterium]